MMTGWSVAILTLCSRAFALATEPVSTPPEVPAGAAISPATSWLAGYQRAKDLMLAGRFAAAAEAFTRLAVSAPDPAATSLAREQAGICRTWADGRFVLVSPRETEDTDEHRARAKDRRTTGEMATLYTMAVLYGVGSGVALATATKPASAAGAILPALAFAGGAVGLVAVLDHRFQLRYGVPQSIVSGMFIGLEEAIAWSTWNQARVFSNDEWSAGQVATLYWSTSTVGALAGGILGTLYGTTPGRASLAGSGALWAGLIAGLTAAALTDRGPRQDDHFMLAAALALNAGGLAGVLVGAVVSPSIARVRFLDLGGIAGGVLFGGLYLSLRGQGSQSDTAAGWIAAGSTVGLASAWILTAGMEPDQPRRGRGGFLSNLVPTLTPGGRQGVLIGLASAL
jgi:hypothetical protein